MKFLMIYPNSTGNRKVPVGVVYILTLLKQAGHEVKLFDATFYGVELEKNDIDIRGSYLQFRPLDLEPYGVVYSKSTITDVERDLAADVKEFQADVIGVTLTEDTSLFGLHLLSVAKKELPAALCIAGGVFCMTMPHYVIKSEAVDGVCIGEGEVAIVELFERLSRKEDYHSVKNFWFKTEAGTTVKNALAPPTNLDDLPVPDLSLVDDRHLFSPMAGHVYKMAFVEGQRGCPRKCSYCCNQLFLDAYKEFGVKQYLRKKSVKNLVAELKQLKERHGLNFIQFTDDDFMLRSPAELEEFRDMYKAEVGLPFWIQAEPCNVTDVKMSLVAEAGCIAASLGIETGSKRILEKVYRRNTPRDKTIRAFQLMHQYGVRTSGNVILGVPDEGRSEIFESIELCRECMPKSFNVNIFAPYMGTKLRDSCVELGYLREDFVREGRLSWSAWLDMPQISREEIQGLARTFVLYATLPREYFPMIEKCEKFSPENDLIFAELEKVFWEIADKSGIDYHVPNIDYDQFLAQRKLELASRENKNGDCCNT